jgi:hypothetical protein
MSGGDKVEPEFPGFDMKTVWKWVVAAFGILLIAVTVYSFWPYWESSRAMRTYCDRVRPGMTMVDVQASAAAFDYSMTPLPDGRLLVQDPVSFGRLTCTLTFDAKGVSAAEFSGGL